MSPRRERAWARAEREGERLCNFSLRQLFAASADGRAGYIRHQGPLIFDFSRERLDDAALESLYALAEAANFDTARSDFLAGEKINHTEGRAALHPLLRATSAAEAPPALYDIAAAAIAGRERMLCLADDLRRNPAVRDVIWIGIGGSYLGPRMVIEALAAQHGGPRIHFLVNPDAFEISTLLAKLSARDSRIVIASKSFRTAESLHIARYVLRWMQQSAPEMLPEALIAVTAAPAKAQEFGVLPAQILPLWDWAGGRFSVWSAIGLPIALALGTDIFRDFLRGAAAMDAHFASAPLRENLPLLFALIAIWRRNIEGCTSTALIPYCDRLRAFPDFIQQLEMESNGKRVDRQGAPLQRAAAAAIWGVTGPAAQHSFFQMLHQGSECIPTDFILPWDGVEAGTAEAELEDLVTASCIAQADALAFGSDPQSPTAAHRHCPGDRPSSLILLRKPDAFALGTLTALWEHKVFSQAVIWDINPFDQWGVELGKSLARDHLERLPAWKSRWSR